MRASRRRLLAVPAAVVLAGALGLTAVAPASAAAPAAQAGVAAQAVPAQGATGHLDAKKKAKPPFAGLTAKQIKVKSAAALKSAKYFRVNGFEIVKKVKYTFDVQVSQGQARGTFVSPSGTERAIRIGNTVYWQYDAKAIESYELPEQLEGMWLKLIPTGSSEWELATRTLSPTAWSTWLGRLNLSSRKAGPKIGGVPTERLFLPGTRGGSCYVAVKGPAYPLLVVFTDKTLTFSFSQFNKAFTVSAPGPDSIVDEAAAE